MIFQTAISPALAETVLRVARCGVTKTVTNTSTTLPILGSPVIIATGTAWNNGSYVAPAITATDITNNLFLGIVHDYAELHTNTAARWGGESQGLVQVYGLGEGLVKVLTDAQGAGSILVPDENMLIGVIGAQSIATANTATPAEVPALAGLVVLLDEIAASTDTDTALTTVFVRAM